MTEPTFRKRHREWVLLILGAVAVRLLYVFCFEQVPVVGDAEAYNSMAWRFLSGGNFGPLPPGEVDRLPLYPLFMGLVYGAFGRDPQAVRVALSLLWGGIVGLTWFLARRSFPDRRVATGASAITAFLPVTVAYAGLLFVETLFTLLLLLSSAALWKALQARAGRWFFFSGILFGLTALTSSRVQFLPLLAAITLPAAAALQKGAGTLSAESGILPSACPPGPRRPLLAGGLLLFGFLLTVSPWTVRNYIVTGQFVFLSTYQYDKSLWLAFNRDGHTELDMLKRPDAPWAGLSPAERRQAIRREAFDELRRYPLHYARNSVRRFFHLWFSSHGYAFARLQTPTTWVLLERGRWRALAVKTALLLAHSGLALLGFWGLWRFRRAWRALLPLYLPIVYLTALHTFFVTSPRFQVPMWPFLAVFASAAAFSAPNRLAVFRQHR